MNMWWVQSLLALAYPLAADSSGFQSRVAKMTNAKQQHDTRSHWREQG
jgi:hypothetical protein